MEGLDELRINTTTVSLYATEKLTITYEAYNLNRHILLSCSLRPLSITMEKYDILIYHTIYLYILNIGVYASTPRWWRVAAGTCRRNYGFVSLCIVCAKVVFNLISLHRTNNVKIL